MTVPQSMICNQAACGLKAVAFLPNHRQLLQTVEQENLLLELQCSSKGANCNWGGSHKKVQILDFLWSASTRV